MSTYPELYKSNNEFTDAARLYPNNQNLEQKRVPIVGAMDNKSPSAPVPSTNVQPVVLQALLGPENSLTTCQFCHASIRTAIKHTITTRTHIAAALCGLVGGCCCIPYCCDSAKNTDHYCPACERYLGTYRK